MGVTDWTCKGCGVKGHRKSSNPSKCSWGEDRMLDWASLDLQCCNCANRRQLCRGCETRAPSAPPARAAEILAAKEAELAKAREEEEAALADLNVAKIPLEQIEAESRAKELAKATSPHKMRGEEPPSTLTAAAGASLIDLDTPTPNKAVVAGEVRVPVGA